MVLEILKWFRSVKNQTHLSRISQSLTQLPRISNSSGFRSVRVPLGFQVDAQSVRISPGSQVPGSSVTGSRSVRISPGSQVGGVKWNRK